MADPNDLLAQINNLAGDARSAEPLAWNQVAGYSQSNAPLTPLEKIQGYSRSYLAGPTFNYADNLEALLASVFTGNTSEQELATIRDQQKRFKDKTDYLDNAVEIASGFMLNPLQKLREAEAIAGPGISTIKNLFTSVPAQAALASAGAADGKNVLGAATTGAVVGSGASAIASVFGNVLEKTARNSDRFKLSAYGIGSADLNKQLKKLGDDAALLGDAGEIPLVKTLKSAETEGLINVSDDALTNAKNVLDAQTSLSGSLTGLLKTADKVTPPRVDFGLNNTIGYIQGLSGTAKESAASAADKELNAIISDLGSGTLQDLQRVKIGLNYKWDQNPYTDSVIKALRSDLRAEIERRVDNAAQSQLIDPMLSGQVKAINQKWGNLAELKDAFVSRGAKDIQSNPLESLIRGGSTTGGVGSLNIASAASGNPVYSAIGATLSAARAPESLNQIAEIMGDPVVSWPIRAAGAVLPEVVTGRSVAQAKAALDNAPEKNVPPSSLSASVSKQSQDLSIMLDKINKLANMEEQKKQETTTPSKTDVSHIENQIDQDPYLSTLYEVESGRDPSAMPPINPKTGERISTAKGGFQFLDSTAKAVGLKDPFDLGQSYEAVKKLTDENRARFGDDPATLYAAHYLGATVLAKVLAKKPLTAAESAQVESLKQILEKRFNPIYNAKVKMVEA